MVTIHSLQWWEKYLGFYTAPITKFWGNVVCLVNDSFYSVFLSKSGHLESENSIQPCSQGVLTSHAYHVAE